MTGWAIGQVIFPILFVSFKNWRLTFCLGLGLPMIINSFLLYKFIDETPRYLVSKERYKEARQILDKISIFNKRPSFKFRLY